VPKRIARAMVTGASAGIGGAFARQLAAHGVELVLVARRRERLDALAAELPVAAEVIVADLADASALARVADRAASRQGPVDLLVNDAGVGAYGALAAGDPQLARAMLAVNVAALTHLTQVVLPQLAQRRTGGVINVGSTAGYRPCPHAAVYGATKAYVRSFTEAVHEEVRDRGVHVMLLAPGSTDTEFQQIAGLTEPAAASRVRASTDEVARAALRAFASGRAVCVPGAGARVAALGAGIVPSRVSRRVSAFATKRMVVG
jgi:uncharacterized protein